MWDAPRGRAACESQTSFGKAPAPYPPVLAPAAGPHPALSRLQAHTQETKSEPEVCHSAAIPPKRSSLSKVDAHFLEAALQTNTPPPSPHSSSTTYKHIPPTTKPILNMQIFPPFSCDHVSPRGVRPQCSYQPRQSIPPHNVQAVGIMTRGSRKSLSSCVFRK